MEYGNRDRTKDKGLRIKILVIVTLLTTYSLVLSTVLYADNIKEPNVAGSFYPDNPAALSEMVDKFLEAAIPESVSGDIFAIVAPHAGYGYSGQTAAYAYKLIKDKPYKTVVVIGTSHQYGFTGVSVYPEGVFRTPLGDLQIDKDFTRNLLYQDKQITFDPDAFAREHSVEVQLPFLQHSLKGFKIVPVVIGDASYETCKRLAELLKAAIGERKDVLVVVSTDMYHGYDFQEADIVDQLTISYLKNMDSQGLYYGLREGRLQLCGGFGMVTALILAGELGHNKLKVLNYTNSAVVTGNKNKGSWTVGYVSCAIDQEKEGVAMLNKEQRKKLLGLARNSIKAYLETGKKPEVKETDLVLNKELGAFVTLHEHGELRGCVGSLIGREPLYLTIRDMAIEAAVGDPRFMPVKPEELKDIEMEISVLSPMERITDVGVIEMGKHGVLVKRGFRSGVYLPQVATETGWPKEEFLSSLCAHKAGLSPDAWKDKDTEIYIFTAEVFSEKEG